MQSDSQFIQLALRLANRAYGRTSPNPMVGAILVNNQKIIGQGWHRRAGKPHAEIEAFRDAEKHGHKTKGATLYVTLEPCSTHGRTPPCTDAIIAAGIKRVVFGATDPNPAHAGRAYAILKRAGIAVTHGVLADECAELNQSFNQWMLHRTPLVTIKAAMSLDGKIATVTGESRWITGEKSRALAMKLRAGADAVFVGVNTIIKDDPLLTIRLPGFSGKEFLRFVLDPHARTPPSARILRSGPKGSTIIIATKAAPISKLAALQRHAEVMISPTRHGKIYLPWILRRLGKENVTSILVEGGGETNAAFLPYAHRVVFFYAPIVIGGRGAPTAAGGNPPAINSRKIRLDRVEWRRIGSDLLLTARVD